MDIRSLINEEVRRAINEAFKAPRNGILELGLNAVSKKRKYADQLWQLIQKNYAYIGGCKTFDDYNGDGGYNDFLNGNYIWRIWLDDNRNVQGGIIYKATNQGRKRVCSVAVNREVYNALIDADFNKSMHVYGEVSGKVENGFNKDKRTRWLPKEDVPFLLPNKQIGLEQDAEGDSKEVLPYDSYKHYYRNLGGQWKRKAMFGNPIMRKGGNDKVSKR